MTPREPSGVRRLRDAFTHEGYALTARAVPGRWVLVYRTPMIKRHELASWLEQRRVA